jgi:hypothetical protein
MLKVLFGQLDIEHLYDSNLPFKVKYTILLLKGEISGIWYCSHECLFALPLCKERRFSTSFKQSC